MSSTMSSDDTYVGAGNLQATLDLLWGTQEPPSRGPKPSLSVEQVVRTAIAVADADGLDALSMRRVADELSVGTMSLYRYVPGKSELVDLMVDAVQAELPTDTEPGAPETWRQGLTTVARGEYALYQRHPWILRVSQARPLFGPHSMAAYDAALRTVDGLGLTAHEMAAMAAMVSCYVQGTARVTVDFDVAARRSGISDEQWWGAQLPPMTAAFAQGRYPTMAAVYEAGAYDPDDDFFSFEFGLQRVLDGVESFVAARQAQP
jgi:AcrR family transcriptional regulator